ncbi:hypothetical protein M426DRAFT_322503 [Hypoxylon sp. CI-4A]|nr:hypothetical protein M426DRAFT_322503 [Hypoxylon sp. CI-4A]
MANTQDTSEPNWRPKAIVFDLLTALTDSWSLWDASTPSATSADGRRWRERYLQLTFGAGTYVPYEDLVEKAAHDVGLPPSASATLLRDWESLQPWPETAQTLRTLRGRGYKLGVVTNCSKSLGHITARRVERSVSEESARDFAFDAVVTAEESGFYKPVRTAYEAVLTLMGVEPSDVLFVAGSAGDVEGATNAGMKVVWHNRIGLDKAGNAVPLREGRTLDDTLKVFL